MVAEPANRRCRVAKVDDNGGASANVGYQMPAGLRLFLTLVHTCYLVPVKLELALLASPCGAPAPFRSGQSQIGCVSSISRDGRPARCRTSLMRRQPSASAERWPVRMRPIRRIHSGGSTRLRNSVSRWKARVGRLVLAVANTPCRQKGCAGPCRSPAQTSFCELTSHLSLYFAVRLRD
jgi:hypothetical protein